MTISDALHKHAFELVVIAIGLVAAVVLSLWYRRMSGQWPWEDPED